MRKTLSYFCVCLLLLSFTIFIGIKMTLAADNLVGYWKFDQGSGTSPIDSSGSNVSGSFTSTQPTWSTDVPSTQFNNPYSLDFGRTGDAVTVSWPTSLNFNETAPRSFSFWYKPTGNGETASGNYDRIISWSDDKFEIAGTYGDVAVHRLAFYDGSWRDTGFDMSVGTWYNITFTYDGTNVKLYVNNSQKFSGTSGGRALSGTMYIGTRYTGDEGINGRIDDVRVYDRALTLSEIQNISEGGSGPGLPTSTPTPAPSSTPTLTPSPTPSPTPAQTIGSNNSTTSSLTIDTTSKPSCNTSAPHNAPDLFQIDMFQTRATLFFTPASNADRYMIAFGDGEKTDTYGAEFNAQRSNGVLSYVVNHLSPQTTYTFKVRGGNGCMPGPWSNLMKVTTRKSTSDKNIYFREKEAKSRTTTVSCRTYVVKPGDSFWKIAAEKLGSGSDYSLIMLANKTKSLTLTPGQKLKIGCFE